jgi:hypothetical protein
MVQRPFLAKYNEDAIWIDDLEPFVGEQFFYEIELEGILQKDNEKDDPDENPSSGS